MIEFWIILSTYILISTVSRRISIATFCFLVAILIGTMSSEIGLKICVITAGIEKYKSIIKEKKKHDKISLTK